MLRLKSLIWYLVLLSLAFPLGNAWAKKPKFDEDSVSAITLDVVRVEACARGKGCIVAGGPMQVNLLDMAKDNIDYVNQVLLPERTRALRLILGDNNTITVDGESFPLTVPSGQTSGLKLRGRRAFPQEGGFLSNLELKLNLNRQLLVKRGKSGSKGSGKGKGKKKSVASSYKLKPVVRVRSAGVEQLPEDMAAVVAMPNEENEIKIGESFSLVIPAGAVATPMVISVKETKYTFQVWDEDTGEVIEQPALTSIYELSPDGAEFDEPLVATVPYNLDTLPSYISEYDIALYLDDEEIPTDINTMLRTATADVWHFSDLNGEARGDAGSGAFVFPFERDHVWQICQGYNNTNITHNSTSGSIEQTYSLDFAYGSNNANWGDNRGCYGTSGPSVDDASGSTGKYVIAPAAGTIAWISSDMTCINLKNAAPNGDGDYIVSVMLGHMKSDEDRAEKWEEVSQKKRIGVLRDKDIGNNFPYAHLHISAYKTINCGSESGSTCEPDPDCRNSVSFGTVFEGDDIFSKDGDPDGWYGKEIPAVIDPATPVVDLVELPKCVLGELATFTVGGTDLSDIVTFELDDCEDIKSSGSPSTTNMQFSCIPSNTIGSKNGIIRNQLDGTELKKFTVTFSENPASLPVVNSVTPEVAVLGEPRIFTVSGENLPPTLAFWIEGCPDVEKIGGDDSNSMMFRCTPSTAGSKDGAIHDEMGGKELYRFQVNVIDDNAPVVDAVSPAAATLNVQTDFTVTGENLPSTLTFSLDDINLQSLGGSSTYMQFRYTPTSTGEKDGVLRDKQGGIILKDNFTVDITDAPVDDEILLGGVRVFDKVQGQTLYENDTANYIAKACFFNRADVDDPTTERDESDIYTDDQCFYDTEEENLVEVTTECTWSARFTMYATSLGNGLVQALPGSAGETVRVICSYDDPNPNSPRTRSGTLEVVVR